MSRATGRGVFVAVLLLAVLPTRAAEVADLVGKTVVAVQLFRDGQPLHDRSTLALVETREGQPLSMRQVRESEIHLVNQREYAGVRVFATEDPGGVVLRYDLISLQAAVDIDVRGALGRSREELLDLITRRFGRRSEADQVSAVVTFLEELYRSSGRFAARITPLAGAPGSGLVFEIDQGPAARINRIDLRGVADDDRSGVLARLGLEVGAVYDPVTVESRLAEYEADMRSSRYYEASFRHDVTPSPDGHSVDLVIHIQTGSHVTLRFAVDGSDAVAMESDPVPDLRVDELVPVAREGSVDEDLLEDSSLRVETGLRRLGYRNAVVRHTRQNQPGELSIVFTVDRGPQYRVADIQFYGQQILTIAELRALFGVARGAPLVIADIEAGVRALRRRYAQDGYRDIQVTPIPDEHETPDGVQVIPVSYTVEIIEGPRTTVGAVSFVGYTELTDEAELRTLVVSARGEAFYLPLVEADVDAVRAHYLNDGYETVQVTLDPSFDESGATVDLTFAIREGPQVVVEHVLLVGNRRIADFTILDELSLRPGEPWGRDDEDESRRRLTALGLFRGVDISRLSHGAGNRRDVVIVVEEAPATRVGYGGGLEVSQRLRASEGGAAAEQLEFAPRGFFQIGRSNLWGKNRSIDLFTRVSVRRKDEADADMPRSSLGFNEYRVLLNYREPRAFGQLGDLSVSGFIEQAIRPSFDLFSRGVNAELYRAIGLTMTGRVGYTYGQNRVTNAQLQPEDVPLVDRLFPTVTLSSFSGGLIRDTRDDPLDPTGGALLGIDGRAAFRSIGSEVGFAKTTLQGFFYHQLLGEVVFAAGARFGLARGFDLQFEDQAVSIQELPASERFFAGGDTTVRGFALDRLGDGPTIDENGFPTGGNALIVLNSELRVPVTGALQVVGFLDAGNVFDRVSNLRLGAIRGSAGFGVRYRSPLGPIRVDLGFKLDRQEFAGEPERLTALHLSIGQAF